MGDQCCSSQGEKPKGFLAKFFEKMDKKMQEKAKQSSCCCSSQPKDGKSEGGSCC